MKKTIILIGFILFVTSCTSGRVEELEAENKELRAALVAAQRVAEEQTVLSQENEKLAKIVKDSAHAALARVEAIKK